MSVIIPNLDRISKDDPKVGEAFKKIQDYTAFNVAPVAGNAIVAAPPTSTPPATTQTVSPNTGSTPVVKPPPPTGTPRPIGGS